MLRHFSPFLLLVLALAKMSTGEQRLMLRPVGSEEVASVADEGPVLSFHAVPEEPGFVLQAEGGRFLRAPGADDPSVFVVVQYCDDTIGVQEAEGRYHLGVTVDGVFEIGPRAAPVRFHPVMVTTEEAVPAAWSGLEIEAKWAVDRKTMDEIVAAFPEDGLFSLGGEDYIINVRWKGVSRKFVDHYYDTPEGLLTASGHSYRVRTRSTSSPRAESNDFDVLRAASWEYDWRKVQYKGTPSRVGAVWFRKEVGSCKLGESCTGSESIGEILKGSLGHDANLMLLDDHPEVDFSAFQIERTVEDYRYRIVLEQEGEEVFELSLDELETRVAADYFTSATRSYEVEAEVVKEDYGFEDIEKLFLLTSYLEGAFQLRSAGRSKGGVPLPNSLVPGATGTCRELEKSVEEINAFYAV